MNISSRNVGADRRYTVTQRRRAVILEVQARIAGRRSLKRRGGRKLPRKPRVREQMFAPDRQIANPIIWRAIFVGITRRRTIIQRVDPLITVVPEIRIKVMQIEARTVAELSVKRTCEAVTFTMVPVLAQVHAAIARCGGVVRAGFKVVDAASVVVEAD